MHQDTAVHIRSEKNPHNKSNFATTAASRHKITYDAVSLHIIHSVQ